MWERRWESCTVEMSQLLSTRETHRCYSSGRINKRLRNSHTDYPPPTWLPGPAPSASPGLLLEMQIWAPCPRFTKSQTPETGTKSSVFYQAPLVILKQTKIQNNWFRIAKETLASVLHLELSYPLKTAKCWYKL